MSRVLTSCLSFLSGAQDVRLDEAGVRQTAQNLYKMLQKRPYNATSWREQILHPDPLSIPPSQLLNWIFLVSILNFSFWSELPAKDRYGIIWDPSDNFHPVPSAKEYDDLEQKWTGYFSLLACLHRALAKGTQELLEPTFWKDSTAEDWRVIFASDGKEEIPLFEERLRVVREAGKCIILEFDGNLINFLQRADKSASRLLDLLVDHFKSLQDDALDPANNERVYFYKRAQIFIAELWASFQCRRELAGDSAPHQLDELTNFHDVDTLTIFADYRLPQILHSMGAIQYSDQLREKLRGLILLPHGSREEMKIRAASIVAAEKIRLEMIKIEQAHPSSQTSLIPLPIVLDFMLWDLSKEEEKYGREVLAHHRTRSHFY